MSPTKKEVCFVAWDLRSFFGSVEIGVLIEIALELSYPPRLLCMSLLIHTCPRVLNVSKLQSPQPIQPHKSIVAGLFDSVALAQALFVNTVKRLSSKFPGLGIFTHVDDLVERVAQNPDIGCSRSGPRPQWPWPMNSKTYNLKCPPKPLLLRHLWLLPGMLPIGSTKRPG